MRAAGRSRFASLALRRGWPALAPLALATCLISTGDDPCTLIGCSDGLGVRVTGVTEGTATIEIRGLAGAPETRTCTGPDHCAIGIFLEDQMPEQVTVTVTVGDRVQTMEADPVYRTSRPNGPSCEPECRQAWLVVALTEA